MPALSEHTMGQLMQMLMLATVVEGRLMGLNPYGQPGAEVSRRHMHRILRTPVEGTPSSQGASLRPGMGGQG
jgi:glucose-6-phosphate isomerase